MGAVAHALDLSAARAAAKTPGATLHLDFGRPLPDMTPDELKEYMGTVFDFAKQRSAAVA
jgi:hypothetical protein